jgi:cob(I)alamin adenosyltransferase
VTKGIFAVFTGEGKGKTTAALGLVFRALGHGHKVTLIQFIKGNWHCGEHSLAEKFPDQLELHVTGKGFTWQSKDLAEDTALAQKAWQLARTVIAAGQAQLVILDELTYLIRYGMVEEAEILEAIKNRPANMHIVVTGRHASENLMNAADLVTEMKEVKHPYKNGIQAQKGFDY